MNYFTSIKSNANILFYTGHIDVIKLHQNAFLIPGVMGFTERTSISFRENVIWNGHIVKIYETHRVEVWCPQWSEAMEDKFSGWLSASLSEAYRAMFTHELGHALGWMGHNPSNNHVMKEKLTTALSGNRDTLSSQDINHILQIYQIYQ